MHLPTSDSIMNAEVDGNLKAPLSGVQLRGRLHTMYNYHTSSVFLAESSQAMSAPAMKQPGFPDTSTADFASGLTNIPSITWTMRQV